MEDVYVEGSVSRQPSAGKKALGFVMFFAGVLLSLLGFVFFVPLCAIGLALLVGCWFYRRSLDVDFDYSFTNGVLDVAKIIAKEKRKELVAVDLKEQLVIMAPAGSDDMRPYEQKRLKTYDCTGTGEDGRIYCLVAKQDGSNENFMITFQPDQTMLTSMHRVRPREVVIARD